MPGLEAFVRQKVAPERMETVMATVHALPWSVSVFRVGKVTIAVNQNVQMTAIVSVYSFL